MVVTAAGVASLFAGLQPVADWLVGHLRPFAAVLCLLFWPLLASMPLILQQRYAGRVTRQGGGKLTWWMLAFVALGFPTLGTPSKMHFGNSIWGLGFFIGVVLDALRRSAVRARWRLRISRLLEVSTKAEVESVATDLTGSPLQCPVLPLKTPAVFISYSR